YARIIGFADSAHLAFERTALTFGGADAFIPTSDGVKVIAAKAQELAKLSEPKGKYKIPLGLTFTAGTFLLNTKSKISLALPPGHRNLTDALSAYISSAKSIFSSDKPVPLTPAQVLALEFLKQVRDDEIPGREGYYASGREIV